MEPHARSTPQLVGTGKERRMENTVEKPSGSKDTGEKASASSSSATTVAKVETSAKRQDKATSSSTTEKGDGICLVCALGTKGSHTYQKECKRFVAGATMEQMKRAARGGRKGHHRLLLVGTRAAKK